jgi:enoyl-CoA hydratase/carnithine racemase
MSSGMTSRAADRAVAPVTVEMAGAVLVIRFDDGKANVLNEASLVGLSEALDAADGARAICLLGRPGFFCAGYDLTAMKAGREAARELTRRGRELLARLAAASVPTVAGVTGHAMAAGAALLLTCDIRVGADGPFRIGFSEVATGMPLSQATVDLAVRRLTPSAIERTLLGSELIDPRRAAEIGFLDAVVTPDKVTAEALARADRLASADPRAMATTKARLRAARAARSAEAEQGHQA